MQTILVTGATDGIGQATARALLASGARVFVHGRNEVRATTAATALGTNAVPVWADFAIMAEVIALAAQVAAHTPRLDVLVNNAGMYAKKRELTVDGFELTMAVNHFAPYLLTRKLLPVLERAPGARIVNVSSMTHDGATLDLDDLDLARRWDAYAAYATSKLANILFTCALATRLNTITANALHPGVIGTKLLRSAFRMQGDTVAHGAATSVYLATSPGVAAISGAYFVASREARASRLAQNPTLVDGLWEASARRLATYL